MYILTSRKYWQRQHAIKHLVYKRVIQYVLKPDVLNSLYINYGTFAVVYVKYHPLSLIIQMKKIIISIIT